MNRRMKWICPGCRRVVLGPLKPRLDHPCRVCPVCTWTKAGEPRVTKMVRTMPWSAWRALAASKAEALRKEAEEAEAARVAAARQRESDRPLIEAIQERVALLAASKASREAEALVQASRGLGGKTAALLAASKEAEAKGFKVTTVTPGPRRFRPATRGGGE